MLANEVNEQQQHIRFPIYLNVLHGDKHINFFILLIFLVVGLNNMNLGLIRAKQRLKLLIFELVDLVDYF
jgi:hypothetical protein